MKDYLAAFDREAESDICHYGVLGMKWGVRKDREKTGERKSNDFGDEAANREFASYNEATKQAILRSKDSFCRAAADSFDGAYNRKVEAILPSSVMEQAPNSQAAHSCYTNLKFTVGEKMNEEDAARISAAEEKYKDAYEATKNASPLRKKEATQKAVLAEKEEREAILSVLDRTDGLGDFVRVMFDGQNTLVPYLNSMFGINYDHYIEWETDETICDAVREVAREKTRKEPPKYTIK